MEFEDYFIYLKHSGNINWNHTLKEIIFPMFMELNKRDLLNKKLKIILCLVWNPLILWESTFEMIFPNYQFEYCSIKTVKEKDMNLIINFYWPTSSYLRCPSEYNRNVCYRDIKLFTDYLDKIIPKPEKDISYDIIIIKRIDKPGIKYYNVSEEDNHHLAGVPVKPEEAKYIINSDEMYKEICRVYNHKKILYVDLIELSFPERYHYFKNAEILIGQHGAAMVQALFIKPGRSVIEYTNLEYYREGCTKQICHVNKIHYAYSLYEGRVFQAITIDIPLLIKQIEYIYKCNRRIEYLETKIDDDMIKQKYQTLLKDYQELRQENKSLKEEITKLNSQLAIKKMI